MVSSDKVNDPKVISKLLRMMAKGTDIIAVKHDVILNVAANLIDPPTSSCEPLFYFKGDRIYQRPVRSTTGILMGFCICVVEDGVDPADVCEILNKGEPATE